MGTCVPTEIGIIFPITFKSFAYALPHARKNHTGVTMHAILLEVNLDRFKCAVGQYALQGHYPTDMDIDYIAIGK